MPHGTQHWELDVKKQTDRGHKWLEPWLPAKPAMIHFCPHADISKMTLTWHSSWMVTHTSTKCKGPKPPASSLKMRLALLRSHTHKHHLKDEGYKPANVRLRRGTTVWG